MKPKSTSPNAAKPWMKRLIKDKKNGFKIIIITLILLSIYLSSSYYQAWNETSDNGDTKLSEWSWEEYDKFSSEISKDNYLVYDVSDFILNNNASNNKTAVIIKHDVDWSLPKARKIAEIELKFGVSSTFYFRLHAVKDDPRHAGLGYTLAEAAPLMIWLYENGFEVGFHYENLYLADGNLTEAHKTFKEELAQLRDIVPITSISSHGNGPEYINYNMWTIPPHYSEYNVTSAFLDFRYIDKIYWSDSHGRSNFGKSPLEWVKMYPSNETLLLLMHPMWWGRDI